MSDILTSRGRVAALSRSRKPDDPDLVGARRDLAASKITEYIRRVVDDAPALTDAQLDRLVVQLRGGTDPGPVAA
jgi:hypothetical protein